MLRNKKGAALMQVLLVTAILAGMATLMLRASLSRTSSVRQTRQTVSTELVIESCQAQVNMMWSKKKPEVFKRDLSGCWMNCNVTIANENPNWMEGYQQSKCWADNETQMSDNATREYICSVPVAGSATPIEVKATFSAPSGTDDNSACKLTYTLTKANSERM